MCQKTLNSVVARKNYCNCLFSKEMSLLSLDHAVWQDILLNWLGSLREIVRLDFAVDVADIKNQFRDVFAQLAFPLPVAVHVTQDLLVGLNSWMHKRNVYLHEVEIREYAYFAEWEGILDWCTNSLKQLRISKTSFGGEKGLQAGSCYHVSRFLHTASIHCQCLREFTLKNGFGQNGETLRTIIRNNASSLEVLEVEKMFGDDSSGVNLDDISCPRLRVLMWQCEEHISLGAFLQRCPNLSALSLYFTSKVSNSLVSVLSDSCPALRKVQCYNLELDGNALLRIARGNSHLEHVVIIDFSNVLSENIVEFMQALPHLHTLTTDNFINEADWLEIAVRGFAPSLRVLDVITQFTCTGFRQFTAAYPHLTGLKLRIIGLVVNTDYKSILQHCGELKHLVLMMDGEPERDVDALLESVALCCPGLEVLELDYWTLCSTWALQFVLDKCTQLKYLINKRDYELYGLNVPVGVTVSNVGPPLAQWMPAADVSGVV